MRRFFLIFNTLRYLKWQQIFYRFVRAFITPKVTEKFQGLEPKRSEKWKHLTLYENKINNKSEACFLNYTKKLDLPSDWNNKSLSKLWIYNLHYFEDLLSESAQEKNLFHRKLLNSWIDENPVGFGNGWEPYPTSLRIVNILKAWLGGLELEERIFNSIFIQASLLSNNLEKHLLGNHYFVNLKALLFAGVIFENINWINIAEKGLEYEIPEQILEDGANFELSPMYHSLILLDMLDMFNLSKAYPSKISNKLIYLIQENIPKMLKFMEIMSHPDQGVSFFNDSVDGIAPKKIKIEDYARKLGFEVMSINSENSQIIDNNLSGYFCATFAGSKLLFDASMIGPDYMPGHAHADTLSFEFSIRDQRIFVNSGISEYGKSFNRINQRKTVSHNTVEVNGRDSSQVWSSFRVANRAKVVSRYAKKNNDIFLHAAHDGYKSLTGGCIHQRNLTLTANSLEVFDTIIGDFKYAIARFYIHPSLDVCIKNNVLKIKGSKVFLRSNTENMVVTLKDSFWYPQFGKQIPNKVIEIKFVRQASKILFTWK